MSLTRFGAGEIARLAHCIGDGVCSGPEYGRGTRGMRVLAIFLTLALGAPTVATAQQAAERGGPRIVEIMAPGVASSELVAIVDLATVLDDSTRRVVPVIGKGSLQSITDLRSMRGIDMAVIQTDVLAAAKTQGGVGLSQSVSYVSKLFNSELHLLAREPIGSVSELAGKKVNVDFATSGTAFTASRVFERLKLRVDATNLDLSSALLRLKSGEIAAVAYMTAKPSPVFAQLSANDGYRLLSLPLPPDALGEYLPARLTSEDYPNLVRGPVDTIGVGTALLVANLQPGGERYRNVSNFVEAFLTQFGRLAEPPHHPRWTEVSLSAEMPGWRRFPTADAWLKANAAPGASLDEAQLRDIFTKFLDERTRLSRGRPLTRQQKDQMFDEFRRWQTTQQQ
jgi:TRAP-type uncharacterized transport system substrate-binding protein